MTNGDDGISHLSDEVRAALPRSCGDCQLCCRLLPVPETGKLANIRCSHQKHGRGCAIYDERPRSCWLWSCRWLIDPETLELSRPDRSHYVIDIMPEFLRVVTEDGAECPLEAVQIWVDPRFPDAHRDPALRRWLEEKARREVVGLLRFSSSEGMVLLAPPLTSSGEWIETPGQCEAEHSAAEITATLTRTRRRRND